MKKLLAKIINAPKQINRENIAKFFNNKYRFVPFIILISTYLSDILSKIVIRNLFMAGGKLAGEHINIVGEFFWLNFHENKGVAFGLFSTLPQSITIPLFTIITIIAIGIISHFYKDLPKQKMIPRISLMMVIGGAAGNLTDRVCLGKVTDFLDFAIYKNGVYDNIWPIFNIADSFILIGVSILVISTIITEHKNKKELKKDNNNASSSN